MIPNFTARGVPALLLSCFLSSTCAVSADVYRWVDKRTGELFFTESPPSPEMATEYTNITQELRRKQLKQQQLLDNQESAGSFSITTEQSTESVPDGNTNITTPGNDISDRELLVKIRCEDFPLQMNRLEGMLSRADTADAMDRIVIQLSLYERTYLTQCGNSQ